MNKERVSVKFAGASGQGINTIGMLLAKTLNEYGFKIFAYREYPSLIKGGIASYQVDFSNTQIDSSSRECNILLAFTDESLQEYMGDVSDEGIIIYDKKEISLTQEQELDLEQRNISLIFLDSENIAVETGGIKIMSNVVMLAFAWKILDLELEPLINTVLEHFKSKNVDLEAERKCLEAGYNSPTFRPELKEKTNTPNVSIFKQSSYVITGNHALSLGAISAGVRAYYAYPMTPATSIFKYLGDTSKKTGMLVKQAENEITAVQMALGSMYMGTRALVATSGGGFDLMTETISCAGISETPLVVILSQRTGAATGLPTWTGAGDLNVAINGGHGEFPRCVIATSDAQTSYRLIQEAFNIAESYQIPVIVLSEKQISESIYSLSSMPKDIPIERGLKEQLAETDQRYQLTSSGISPRWVPSKGKKPYLASSDEHAVDGMSIEDSEEVIAMSQKRMAKLEALKDVIPEPELYGEKDADIIFVGWGSVKSCVLDALSLIKKFSDKKAKCGYLHYEFMFPLKTKLLKELIEKKKRLVLIENNQSGQLGEQVMRATGFKFKERILKYDGRPFFVEDILDFLEN